MYNETYESSSYAVADVTPEERAAFIRRTYAHLAGAILAFVGVEWLLFQAGVPEKIYSWILDTPFSWLMVLGIFMAMSWFSEKMANSDMSSAVQYGGLGIYVIAEALIFAPLLYLVIRFSHPDVIPMAAIVTLLLFAGITFTAFTTRKDFSFLGGILKITAFIALGVIIASIVIGFNLGLLFAAIMVLFAGGCILYTTSNIIHRYNTNQHVAAALSLFASVMLMFWYLIRILNRARD